MKQKFFVPYETAKALKGKGYPQDLDDNDFVYTLPRGGFYPTRDIDLARLRSEGEPIPAPTYHEVLDWLESKGICIHTDVAFKNNGNYWGAEIDSRLATRLFTDLYPTREEALNAAILKALELI